MYFFTPNFYQYQNITVCNNTLINVQYIFHSERVIPIIIGNDPMHQMPVIWLYGYIDGQLQELIIKNEIKSNRIRINYLFDSNRILIQYGYDNLTWQDIIDLTFDSTSLKINRIELHHIGFNIDGDQSKLHVGSRTIEGAQVMNLDSFIEFH